MAIQTVGIVGAGTMGNGIAQACAVSGINVVMVDISDAAVQKGLATVSGSLDRLIKKEKITAADKDKALSLIKTSTNYDDLKGAQLVIEAATENFELKVKILKQLDELLGADVLVATNTSSISITKIAAAAGAGAPRVISAHFMNPVPVQKGVEIITGLQTSPETLATTLEVVKRMGKIPSISKDSPGFLANRILMPYINEAIITLETGVGEKEDIDNILKNGCAMPMGPLALADFIGLDTCLAIMRVLYEDTGDSKYRPSVLLNKYVDAGWLGKKSGKGFYDY